MSTYLASLLGQVERKCAPCRSVHQAKRACASCREGVCTTERGRVHQVGRVCTRYRGSVHQVKRKSAPGRERECARILTCEGRGAWRGGGGRVGGGGGRGGGGGERVFFMVCVLEVIAIIIFFVCLFVHICTPLSLHANH